MAETVFNKKRYHLRTDDLLSDLINPALNNIYDVEIKFDTSGNELRNNIQSNISNPLGESLGDRLALFCSEATLPGSNIQTSRVDGLRQGITQNYAVYRRYPPLNLVFFVQQDYFTQEVFTSWLEFISPLQSEYTEKSFKKLRYTNYYKCSIDITSFNRNILRDFDKLRPSNFFTVPTITDNIVYSIKNAFPIAMNSSPLTYGDAEIIRTTVSFVYEHYIVSKTK